MVDLISIFRRGIQFCFSMDAIIKCSAFNHINCKFVSDEIEAVKLKLIKLWIHERDTGLSPWFV